ncbi:hypothetical protein L596_026489 [Steinernema carpocapsae]|uniref:G-protein coupled receptors family 1 profile domain-containing protein n=1 Tax=Steinernema carpocapsae TaxID=34508 RepID=A0A4U5M1J4_STECR|nr:hypothetical protein L596_026489 [Steinernema carpocapsae]
MKKNEKKLTHKKTVKIQKTVLWNLLILSSVPILMAVVPTLIGEVYMPFRYLPNANLALEVMSVILLNYGTVYGIMIFYLFKDYRKVVERMLLCVLEKCVVVPKTVVVAVSSSNIT